MNRSQRRHRRLKERKFDNLAAYLTDLARNNPKLFMREWEKRLRSWIDEIHYRGRRLRMKNESKESFFKIFAVLEQVEQFLLLHPEINGKVGAATRDVLQHESAKALAAAADGRLYRLVKQYSSKFDPAARHVERHEPAKSLAVAHDTKPYRLVKSYSAA